ncbi:MAG: hypothetical protein KDK36_17560, partial [Leptospiraceae bacterium]|nr:hypothetical protein [Leptospiraceae bacterium]
VLYKKNMKKLIYKVEEASALKKNFINIKQNSLHIWQKFLNFGIHPEINYEYNVRIKILNYTSLFFLVISLLQELIIFIKFEQVRVFPFIQVFLFVSSIVLLKNRNYLFAKFLSLTSILTFFSSINFFYGDDWGFGFYFLSLMFFGYMVFSNYEKIYADLFSSMIIAVLFLMIFSSPYLPDSKIELKSSINMNTVLYLNLSISVILFFRIYLTFINKEMQQTPKDKKLVEILKEEVYQRQISEQHWSEAIQLQIEIMNSIPSDVVILDNKGDIFRINQVREPFIKDSIIEIPNFGVGTNFFENVDLIYKNAFISPGSIINAVKDVLIGKTNFNELTFTSSHNSDYEWYKLKISKIENDAFQGVFLMLANITEQKRAEELTLKMEKLNFALSSLYSDFMFNMNELGVISEIIPDSSSPLMPKSSGIFQKSIYDLGLPDKFINEILETVRQSIRYGSTHTIKYDVFDENSTQAAYEVKVTGIDQNDAFVIIKLL